MATADEIAEVREYVAEPDNSNGWTDTRVGTFIDREDDLFLAAAAIWSATAGAYAGLVNVSESGSSRSLGTLIDNALKMVAFYRGRSAESLVPPDGGYPVISKLVRP
jgi:hypothetical protein